MPRLIPTETDMMSTNHPAGWFHCFIAQLMKDSHLELNIAIEMAFTLSKQARENCANLLTDNQVVMKVNHWEFKRGITNHTAWCGNHRFTISPAWIAWWEEHIV